MKHILNKSTYFLFSIIAPIVYLLTCKLGGVGVKGFLLSTGNIAGLKTGLWNHIT